MVEATDKGLYEQFLGLLDKALIEYAYADLFAEALGVTQKKLNAIARDLSGKTACQLVEERIVDNAMGLLRSTSLPIQEIAWKLGYEDQYYFSRMFKKVAGLSPRQYRTAPASGLCGPDGASSGPEK
jgi:AraC-like DNA-binding protein